MSKRMDQVREAAMKANGVFFDPYGTVLKLQQDIRDQNRVAIELQDRIDQQKGRIKFLNEAAFAEAELNKKLQSKKDHTIIQYSMELTEQCAKINLLQKKSYKLHELTDGLSVWRRLKFLFTGEL